jgi:antitoxin HicB
MKYNYTVLYEPAEEGGYIVTCPALPGLVTEGDTLEEARAMAIEAIQGYLESLAKAGLSAPVEEFLQPRSELLRETVSIAVG